MSAAKKPRAKPAPKTPAPVAHEASEQMAVAIEREPKPDALKVDPKSVSPEMLKTFGESLPAVLLPYQRDLFVALEEHDVVVYEKSRRIGATWGVGAYAVLMSGASKAAGGQDTLYIGFNLELAREFIDCCAMWSRAFMPAVSAVQEFLFDDDVEGDSRQIKAFRIDYFSGYSIVALSSKPRSLRGRQGFVIFDEAAFHDELDEMMKAALALLIWGGKLLIISTHDGVDNAFNRIVVECRAAKKNWKVLRTTFAEAVEQGLYQRVCLAKGKPWTKDGEDAWTAKIRDDYGDAGGEELDCVPRQSGGRFLSRALLEARVVDAPILFLALESTWVDKAEHDRVSEIETWCKDNIVPILKELEASSSFVGFDFGRSGDLSVLWPLVMRKDLSRHTPFLVELRNVPFMAQRQLLFFVIDHLPNWRGAALDARGNGQYLAEVTRQEYGPDYVDEVMLSENWYREHMPRMKAALEDATLDLPRDADVVDDFLQLELVRGVARVPDKSRQTKARGQRHADSAVAGCLALCASNTLTAGPVDVHIGQSSPNHGRFFVGADQRAGALTRRNLEGFNS